MQNFVTSSTTYLHQKYFHTSKRNPPMGVTMKSTEVFGKHIGRRNLGRGHILLLVKFSDIHHLAIESTPEEGFRFCNQPEEVFTFEMTQGGSLSGTTARRVSLLKLPAGYGFYFESTSRKDFTFDTNPRGFILLSPLEGYTTSFGFLKLNPPKRKTSGVVVSGLTF